MILYPNRVRHPASPSAKPRPQWTADVLKTGILNRLLYNQAGYNSSTIDVILQQILIRIFKSTRPDAGIVAENPVLLSPRRRIMRQKNLTSHVMGPPCGFSFTRNRNFESLSASIDSTVAFVALTSTLSREKTFSGTQIRSS